MVLLILVPALALSGQAAELPIAPLLDSTVEEGVRVFKLYADESKKTFLPSKKRATPTLGYNGDYLGPTIRVRRGDRVRMEVENRLKEPTTVHWHGMDVPARADGNVHQPIPPGKTWAPTFPIRQQAATLWYHPHFHRTTAQQVYEGLAGLIIVDDKVSDSLNLPRKYGVDDLPLILQERRFDSSGRFAYRPSMSDIMHGYFGNTMLVNGAVSPTVDRPRKPLRLRILNGSNSSILRLSVKGLSGFYQIATDGGFLEEPVPLNQLVLATGERAELVLDLARATGKTVVLRAESNGGRTYQALTINLTGTAKLAWRVPKSLARIARIPAGKADNIRDFIMETRPGGLMTINGRQMSMNRIDEKVKLGDTEIWVIENRSGGMGRGGMGMGMQLPHSFHVHAVQFLILDINGRRPPAQLSGWKDTVLLWPGDKVRFIASYTSYPGLFMYHCHFLEHEDSGMMGNFVIWHLKKPI